MNFLVKIKFDFKSFIFFVYEYFLLPYTYMFLKNVHLSKLCIMHATTITRGYIKKDFCVINLSLMSINSKSIYFF